MHFWAAALALASCTPANANRSGEPPATTTPSQANDPLGNAGATATGTQPASTPANPLASSPAPDLSNPPKTVDELINWERGTPQASTLYTTGNEPGSELFDIQVDQDAVYWTQKAGRLFRGAKDGSTPPEHIGQWQGTLGGDTMLTDKQHVLA